MPETNANPNDPALKRQNDEQFFAAVLDICIKEQMVQQWQIDGELEALKNQYLRKKILESAKQQENINQQQPTPTVSTRQTTPEKEAEKPKNLIPDRMAKCEEILANAREKSGDAIKKRFANDPVMQKKALDVRNNVFSKKTLRVTAELYQQTMTNTVHRETINRDAHPVWRDDINNHLDAAKKAHEAGNEKLAAKEASMAAQKIAASEAAKEEFKTIATVSDIGKAPTADQRDAAKNGNTYLFQKIEGGEWIYSYENKSTVIDKDSVHAKTLSDKTGGDTSDADIIAIGDFHAQKLDLKSVTEKCKEAAQTLKDTMESFIEETAENISKTGIVPEIIKLSAGLENEIIEEERQLDIIAPPPPLSTYEETDEEENAFKPAEATGESTGPHEEGPPEPDAPKNV
ncbi:MAG: hypothetical protein A3E82_05975 [Gammaproteobacteria bacterium RIFCSPHIGHO2_12_FULL_38_11]|nr:MAG: hypothetical protein A3E82_05975 [Gammaproteobacteria bacterium RIFCSPHIGHO2_12_FULL_38_11]